MSVNYDYIVHKIYELYQGDKPICLDFGCGAGQIVERGLAAGLDFYGADAYPEDRTAYYRQLLDSRPDIKQRIARTNDDGTLPYPDAHFDVVVSNMVFEHIRDLAFPLKEIQRVLKPDGLFLALFPAAETLWEGHAKLYFAHKFRPGSPLQIKYLSLMKKSGFGKKTGPADENLGPEDWAAAFGTYFREYCFYHTGGRIESWWYDSFSAAPEGWEADYMLYRLGKSKLGKLVPLLKLPPFRPLLAWACRLRASRVLAVRKPKASVREARRAA